MALGNIRQPCWWKEWFSGWIFQSWLASQFGTCFGEPEDDSQPCRHWCHHSRPTFFCCELEQVAGGWHEVQRHVQHPGQKAAGEGERFCFLLTCSAFWIAKLCNKFWLLKQPNIPNCNVQCLDDVLLLLLACRRVNLNRCRCQSCWYSHC